MEVEQLWMSLRILSKALLSNEGLAGRGNLEATKMMKFQVRF